MPSTTLLLNAQKDRGIVDTCRAVERLVVPRDFKFFQYPFGWILVVFFDSGVVDHPMRELAGHEGGKGELHWFERKHEVVGVGASPEMAARDIIGGGKGARLKGERVFFVGDSQPHLIFKHLDSKQIFTPTPAGLVGSVPS